MIKTAISPFTLRRSLSIAALSLLPWTAQAATSVDDKVESLLAKMTLREKVGQMNQYNGFWDATGPAPAEGDSKKKYEDLKQGMVGSVLNVIGARQVREFQDIAVKHTRLGIPLIFGRDVIHGEKTIFPIPLAEASSWDLGLIERAARDNATEAAAMGINLVFSPMVDVTYDARWGRVMEGAGEDPYLVGKIGAAWVRGYQGDDLSRNDTVAACLKHFAGYAFVQAGRDYNWVDVGRYTLYNTILPPFKEGVDAGAATVMNAFTTIDGTPATASAFLQRDVLRGRWGFNGVIISDWSSGRELIANGVARDLAQVTELAVNAGSDIDMESYAYVNNLEALVKSGKVKMATVDDAVRRILKLKYELGLFDDPYKYIDEKREKEVVQNKKFQDDALDAARKSIVLLKNEKNLLPLSKSAKNIAVIGPLAADKTSPLGNWRLGGEENSAVSLLEGMARYTKVAYAPGVSLLSDQTQVMALPLKFNTTDKSGIEKAKALAKKADVVVMLLGEHGLQTGEGRSQTRLDFPGLQQELLEAVYSVNKNIVLLVASGRPLVLTWADQHLSTIVQTWQLGSKSGDAIAQVLFGDYNPSGKLPMSFPRSVGQLPFTYRSPSTGRPGPNPTVFWSRYTDEVNDALYPFGHGLSYTKFAYSDLKVEQVGPRHVRVSATVKNTGGMDGEEVAQLYVHARLSTYVRPVKELKGFQKFALAKGESKVVSFDVTDKELGYFDADGKFMFEPGEYDFMIGTSSAAGVKGSSWVGEKPEAVAAAQ
jgi:beta-glucosidase